MLTEKSIKNHPKFIPKLIRSWSRYNQKGANTTNYNVSIQMIGGQSDLRMYSSKRSRRVS